LEEEQTELTFGQLYDLYLERYAKLHTKTWEELEKNYERYFKDRWHTVRVSTIKRTDVQNWYNKLADQVREQKRRKRGEQAFEGRHTANRNFDTFRAILNWGRDREHVKLDGNPCAGIDKFKTKARERFLLPGDEYNRFMASVEAEPNPVIRNFVKLCMLTGMRSGNVMAMRWDEIDWDLATWSIADTKNNDSQRVNLTPAAMALLKEIYDNRTCNTWVLPARGKGKTGHLVEPKNAWKKIIERAEISDLRPHDLRRTVGSYMAIQGVDTKIIGKALGHRSAQATAIYARLTQDPVRIALENAQAAFGDPSKLLSSRSNGEDRQ
jgi:integrase